MCPRKHAERDSSLSPVLARRQFAHEVLNRAQAQGGVTLLVDGLAGMGKTFILRELISNALADESQHVTVVRADEIESGEPYSFIERFVASSLIPDWHFVPTAQTSPVPVARECVQRLVAESTSVSRVVIIDDAQWIDAESQRVLRYLIPRVTRRRMLLAFGVRTPHSPGSFGEFLTDLVADSPLDVRYSVSPLTAHEVGALVVERLGVGISTQAAQRLVDITGGSFLEIDSILSTLTEDEVAQLHVSWNPPMRSLTAGNDPLLHQFTRLSPEARATCEIVCLAGHELSHDDLTAAANVLKEPVSLSEAIAAGVLTTTGSRAPIMPRHALLAQAVSQTVPEARSRSVLQALANITDGYRSLRHRLLSAEQWDEDLHAQVNDYVHAAAEESRFSSAIEILRAALKLVTEPEARVKLLQSLSLIHMQAKTSYEMLDLLDEIEQLPPSLLNEVLYLVLVAHNIREPLPQQRIRQLLATTPATADERAVLAFFTFLFVILTMRSPHLDQVPPLIDLAKVLVQQAPREAHELSDPRLAWMVAHDEYLLVLDSYRMVQDQMASDMDLVVAALPGLTRRIDRLADGPLKVDAIVAVAGAQLATGNVETGHALAQQGVDLLERVSEPWAASTARLILAHTLVLRGEYDVATELMELAEEVAYSALDVETRSGWAALRVIIAAVTGDHHAEVFVEQAKRQRDIAWEGYSPDLTLVAECELARVQGDHASILAASSGSWAERLANTRRGFLTYRAHALIDTQQLDEATTLIDQLSLWRGTRWHEYSGTLAWLRARLAEAQGDTATAQWHYESAITNRAFPLPLGLTLADYGEFLISQSRNEAGIHSLQSALKVLDSIGADGYLPKVRNLIEQTSRASARQAGAQLFEALTDRERQIAQHLAKGRSNNQIAESLVVSVATVRSHVSNVLRKLQLSSRGEVARLLREK